MTLRTHLAAIGGLALAGLVLIALAVRPDRIGYLFVAFVAVTVLGIMLARLMPRGSHHLKLVIRLVQAMLGREERRASEAPISIKLVQSLPNGALLVRLVYGVGTTPLDRRVIWLKSAMGVPEANSIEPRDLGGRVLEITVGALRA